MTEQIFLVVLSKDCPGFMKADVEEKNLISEIEF